MTDSNAETPATSSNEAQVPSANAPKVTPADIAARAPRKRTPRKRTPVKPAPVAVNPQPAPSAKKAAARQPMAPKAETPAPEAPEVEAEEVVTPPAKPAVTAKSAKKQDRKQPAAKVTEASEPAPDDDVVAEPEVVEDSTSELESIRIEPGPAAEKPRAKRTPRVDEPVRPPIRFDTKVETPLAGKAYVASVRVASIDPWSVARLAFVVSVALMIVSVVAVAVLWIVLSITGVWSAINDSVTNVLSDDSTGFKIGNVFGFGRLVGFTLMASALNVVFMTALATISAHLYNLAAQIIGGFKVHLSGE